MEYTMRLRYASGNVGDGSYTVENRDGVEIVRADWFLNNIVSGYFDFAEIMALEHKPVYMMDYVKQLDSILMSTGRPLLQGTGSVSHEDAMEKALAEYRKYQVKTLSPVEQAYLDSIKMLGKKGKRNTGNKK